MTGLFIGYSKPRVHKPIMIRTTILTIASALLLAATPAVARGDRDQDNLRDAAAQGQVVPLGKLIADVRSRSPYRDMTYLGGPQFDPERMIYKLKFMDGSQVVVVYVDARTGRIVGRKP